MMDTHLEFESEMLLSILRENSLTITSRGIANDRLLVHLVRTFSSPCLLVLVIGADIEEEDSVIMQVTDGFVSSEKSPGDADENFVPPKRIVSESGLAANRRDIYLSGGVIFITTRILVVDMLTKRLPFESVSGIIVANAHRVLKDCHLSFILRLFRMNNKSGFITAISQNAPAFLGSFAKLERIMRNLFVSKLFLWPRFHATINSSLSTRTSPNVVEMRIHMTPAMKQIQFALIDLISKCIKDLTSMNSFIYSSTLDIDEKEDQNALNTINVISKSFNKIMRAHLDSVWFQLSPRARSFIRDIRLLKSLLFHLTELDAVSFHGELKHIRDNVTPESNPSDWLFWPQTETLFKVAQERVFDTSVPGKKPAYNIEINPKLDSLNDLLNEIEETERDRIREKRSRLDNLDDVPTTEPKVESTIIDIIIVLENRYAVRQIEDFRDKGKEVVLDELKNKCEILSDNKLMSALKKKPTSASSSSREFPSSDIIELEDQLTLTQMLGQFQTDEEQIIRKHNRLQLHYFEWGGDGNSALGLKRMLTAIRPPYVILYEPEMSCIRQIELYQALFGDELKEPVNVYYFIFDGSAEEQRYLRNLQVEKESFEKLIAEKSKLAKVSHGDGLTDLHPDLMRGTIPFLHPDEQSAAGSSSRIGGGAVANNAQASTVIRQVLVDMREFRSLLPSFVHKIGIELEPVTLEIGDYILSADTCLERKSVSDLIGSLNSGRLYSQAQMMTRYYKRPLLLIEFDEAKSFNFKARYWSGAQNNGSFQGRPSPLLQLAVLTVHFPLLRIIWSPTPAFSAEMIDQLKQGRDEPEKERDIIRLSVLTTTHTGSTLKTVGGKELPREFITDRYDIEAKEFLLALPGVTSANVYSIMNQVPSIAALVDVAIEELTEIMGSSMHADMLHRALHGQMSTKEAQLEQERAKANAKKRFAFARKKPNKK